MREPAGILHDLVVDFIDGPADLSSFDADLVSSWSDPQKKFL